jgi:hypothetical protein
MGLDLLDIMFRLEKQFGIKIFKGEMEVLAARHDPPHLRVGDLLDLVRSKRKPLTLEAGTIVEDVLCAGCGYNLRGLRPEGDCPECGAPAGYEAQTWHGVRQTLRDALGVDPEAVRPAASLRALGSE